MKIIYQKDKCVGCGLCVSICPKFFETDEHGKVHLIKGTDNSDLYRNSSVLDIEKIGCAQEAADSCPVQCIIIKK